MVYGHDLSYIRILVRFLTPTVVLGNDHSRRYCPTTGVRMERASVFIKSAVSDNPGAYATIFWHLSDACVRPATVAYFRHCSITGLFHANRCSCCLRCTSSTPFLRGISSGSRHTRADSSVCCLRYDVALKFSSTSLVVAFTARVQT